MRPVKVLAGLAVVPFVSSSVITHLSRRQVSNASDPPFQYVPRTQQKPDNTFATSANAAELVTEPPVVSDPVPAVYGTRSIDIPFGRLHFGDLKYFPPGQLNTPDGMTDQWAPNVNDFANQSACGIPDSAFFISKVAIHPYFLKYAPQNLGLSRYCMQDVCISFITKDWTQDMILKVTDMCCTDASDPNCCATPNDIKIDRTKAQILFGFSGDKQATTPELNGTAFPEQANWFFTKCWDDALVQPAYSNNWWAQPPHPNNEQVPDDISQAALNNISYPALKNWKPYPNSGYNENQVPFVIDDWAPGDPTPSWKPLAGGRGWGDGMGIAGDSSSASSGNPTLVTNPSATEKRRKSKKKRTSIMSFRSMLDWS